MFLLCYKNVLDCILIGKEKYPTLCSAKWLNQVESRKSSPIPKLHQQKVMITVWQLVSWIIYHNLFETITTEILPWNRQKTPKIVNVYIQHWSIKYWQNILHNSTHSASCKSLFCYWTWWWNSVKLTLSDQLLRFQAYLQLPTRGFQQRSSG